MKKIALITLLLLHRQLKAQHITGWWLSADSSRLYEIKAMPGNLYEAAIRSSSRKTDSTGFVVIKAIQYNKRKKRYEGIIYTTSDNQPCFVKITAANNQLILKLSRLFLFDAVLRWKKAAMPAEWQPDN